MKLGGGLRGCDHLYMFCFLPHGLTHMGTVVIIGFSSTVITVSFGSIAFTISFSSTAVAVSFGSTGMTISISRAVITVSFGSKAVTNSLVAQP